MSNSFLLFTAFVTGSLVPLQLVFNAQLGTVTRSPYSATLIVFVVGLLAMAVVCLVMRPSFPSAQQLLDAPPTVFFGGIIAAIYMVAIIFVSPKLGVGLTTALILCGQLVMALTLDHLGAFGNPQISLNLWRVAGVLMMLGGVAAIKMN